MSPKERAKDNRLKKEFGLSLIKYRLISVFQKNCCGICKKPRSNFKNDLAVDHDHKTGVVRGLLCMHCNRALGKWRDNDTSVVAAANYVTQPPAIEALGTMHVTAPGRVGTKVRAKLLTKVSKSK